MKSINDYFIQSELALAAYATLASSVPNISELKRVGMTPLQAQTFAGNWTVVDQYDGTVEETYTDEFGQEHTFLNHTGLSVTLFENSSGKQVVAIRGTEPTDPADLFTDAIDILVLGTSENQAQYAALSTKVQQWMDEGVLQSGFSVTGHSLGGFLATNLSLEYAADVMDTYIYNAPGVTGIGGNILEAIGNALSPDNPVTIPAVMSISNIVATNDVVSSVGLYIAPPLLISVDAQSSLGAHSIVGLTATLAIYNLFSTISGSNNVDDFTPILENMSDEHVLSVINTIFQAGVGTGLVPVDRAMELTGYVNDHGLTGLTVAPLNNQSASSLQSAAASDNALLFALQELAGFTISGNQPGYNNLDSANYSDHYLEDRAAFLYYSIRPLEAIDHFEDLEIPFTLERQPGLPAPRRSIVFGGEGDDQLEGTNIPGRGDNFNDHLYGMAGDDTLNGYGGNDILEGGMGSDPVYNWLWRKAA